MRFRFNLNYLHQNPVLMTVESLKDLAILPAFRSLARSRSIAGRPYPASDAAGGAFEPAVSSFRASPRKTLIAATAALDRPGA